MLALWKTDAESTPARNFWAALRSLLTIVSVCPEPRELIKSIAACVSGTIAIDMIRSVYSVAKSCSLASTNGSPVPWSIDFVFRQHEVQLLFHVVL